MSNQPQVKPDHMLRRMVLSFVIVACSLQAGCAARQLMPTPNLYVNAPVDPFAKVVPAYQTNEVNVLYATDRLPVQTDEGNLDYWSTEFTLTVLLWCVRPAPEVDRAFMPLLRSNV